MLVNSFRPQVKQQVNNNKQQRQHKPQKSQSFGNMATEMISLEGGPGSAKKLGEALNKELNKDPEVKNILDRSFEKIMEMVGTKPKQEAPKVKIKTLKTQNAAKNAS